MAGPSTQGKPNESFGMARHKCLPRTDAGDTRDPHHQSKHKANLEGASQIYGEAKWADKT